MLLPEEACLQLRIDMESKSDTVIAEEHLEGAIKIGVETKEVTDIYKYIIAFLRKLFFHRAKLEKSLLGKYLNPTIVIQWQEVLSTLEDKDRKLVNIQSGSILFMLYCPTQKSRLQIQDEKWRIEIQRKMAKLLKLLGKL